MFLSNWCASADHGFFIERNPINALNDSSDFEAIPRYNPGD